MGYSVLQYIQSKLVNILSTLFTEKIQKITENT